MNRWDCQHRGCKRHVLGTGGAVGLRAVGWQVSFAGPPGSGPRILCPAHRYDTIPCQESPGRSFLCSLCRAEADAGKLQELIYTPADREVLEAMAATRRE